MAIARERLERERLVVEQEMAEDQRERRRHRLQDGGQSRGNELRAPEEQRVVDAEQQEPGDGDDVPVARARAAAARGG